MKDVTHRIEWGGRSKEVLLECCVIDGIIKLDGELCFIGMNVGKLRNNACIE